MTQYIWLNDLDGYEDLHDGYLILLDPEECALRIYSYRHKGKVDPFREPKRMATHQRKTLNKGRRSFVLYIKSGRRTTTKCVYSIAEAALNHSAQPSRELPTLLPTLHAPQSGSLESLFNGGVS